LSTMSPVEEARAVGRDHEADPPEQRRPSSALVTKPVYG
jgi:hypothetical protein